MSVVEPKPKQLQRTIGRKKNVQECQSELKVKNKQTAKKRGNTRRPNLFASNQLREWCEFSGPITNQIKGNPMQFQVTFNTQLKIALRDECNYELCCYYFIEL